MEEVVVTPMEEDEVLGVVRHSFECDLGVCGGRHNVNHMHTEECSASTSGRERIDSPSEEYAVVQTCVLRRMVNRQQNLVRWILIAGIALERLLGGTMSCASRKTMLNWEDLFRWQLVSTTGL